jgi:hypothetical protein
LDILGGTDGGQKQRRGDKQGGGGSVPFLEKNGRGEGGGGGGERKKNRRDGGPTGIGPFILVHLASLVQLVKRYLKNFQINRMCPPIHARN